MDLVLIRHGLPIAVENSDGSPADPPLSETGREQAQRLCKWLAHERLDAVYSSPLRRARETADPLVEALGVDLRIEPGVVEFDAASSVYVPLEQLREDDYERWLELVRGGLYSRIDLPRFKRDVIEIIGQLVRRHPGERIAVVCHGGVINAWAGHVLGIESPLFFAPDYTSLHRFMIARSGFRSMQSLNETPHLRDLV